MISSKPYNRVILRAKINAFRRMRELHQSLQKERDLSHRRNEQMLHEQEMARRVFDNIAHRGCLGAENIRYEASPCPSSTEMFFLRPQTIRWHAPVCE